MMTNDQKTLFSNKKGHSCSNCTVFYAAILKVEKRGRSPYTSSISTFMFECLRFYAAYINNSECYADDLETISGIFMLHESYTQSMLHGSCMSC